MLRFFKSIIVFASDFLLRFYNEIIAGVWSILVCIPLDAYLYKIFDKHPSYILTTNYWICFGIYSVFFILSAILVPHLKEWNVMKEIDLMTKKQKITIMQRKKIKSVIKDVLIYKNIFTKEGLLQFIMANMFNISIIMAYFGIEQLITNKLNDTKTIVPYIFLFLFILILTIESFLDDYLSQKLRSEYRASNSINMLKFGTNKNLLTLILRNLGGGGTLSFKLSQLLVEDAIDDIYEILDIANSMEETRKKSNYRKSRFINRNNSTVRKKTISFTSFKKKQKNFKKVDKNAR